MKEDIKTKRILKNIEDYADDKETHRTKGEKKSFNHLTRGLPQSSFVAISKYELKRPSFVTLQGSIKFSIKNISVLVFCMNKNINITNVLFYFLNVPPNFEILKIYQKL